MLFLLANALVTALTAHVVAGVAFAAWFLPHRAARYDAGLDGAGLTVRLLIAPGIVALWPLFARRLLDATGTPAERNAHRQAAEDVRAVLRKNRP